MQHWAASDDCFPLHHRTMILPQATRNVCVFCSSSSAVDSHYFDTAREFGTRLGESGATLVFGGANVGMMGVLARAVHAGGGRVIGVIPEMFVEKGIVYKEADELIVTADLRDRKRKMEQRSDGFVVLPGGFGTFDELFDILSLRHLRAHTKPVVLLNSKQYFDPLLDLFEHIFEHRFARDEHRAACQVATDAAEALDLAGLNVPFRGEQGRGVDD